MDRRTPLTRKTPLSGGSRPIRRTSIARGGPLPAARATARTRDASDPDHSRPMGEARAMVWARSRGRCDRCGQGLPPSAWECHHRLSRRYGPDCPCNLLALCRDCHHTHVHGAPQAARESGWIVASTGRTAPLDVAVLLPGGLAFLTCHGGTLPPPIAPEESEG